MAARFKVATAGLGEFYGLNPLYTTAAVVLFPGTQGIYDCVCLAERSDGVSSSFHSNMSIKGQQLNHVTFVSISLKETGNGCSGWGFSVSRIWTVDLMRVRF